MTNKRPLRGEFSLGYQSKPPNRPREGLISLVLPDWCNCDGPWKLSLGGFTGVNCDIWGD